MRVLVRPGLLLASGSQLLETEMNVCVMSETNVRMLVEVEV